MKTKKPIVLLALVLLTTAAAQSVKKPAKKPILNTRTASCLVKITSDPAVLPLNEFAIDYLLRSSGVAGKAAREILEIPLLSDETDELVDFGIEPLPGEPQDKREGVELGEEYFFMHEYEKHMTMRRGPRVEGILGNKAFISGRWFKVGDNIGGAKVLEIKPMYVKVEWQGQQKTLFPVGAGTTYASEQPLFFQLGVELESGVKPAAEEFMNALIENLRETLTNAYENQEGQLQDLLEFAEEQHGQAELELKLSQNPADVAVYHQLEEIVHLSQLTPTMPFREAIEEIKNSVDPPLKIVVLWRDLYDNAEVESSTEINMDGLPAVRLGTGLENLLKAVSGGFGEDIGFVVENGVVTVATVVSLPTSRETLLQSTQLSVEMNLEKKQNLLREKQNLEMQVAALAARSSAIEQQVANISKQVAAKVEADPIAIEFQKIVDIHTKNLENIQKPVKTGKIETTGTASSAEVEYLSEKLARARIELAQHREQVAKSAGGDQLAEFNKNLSTLMVDLAEKTAMLSIVSDQLRQTEKELTAAATFDPQVAQIRFAKVALELANQRINELKTRLANLQPPTVTVLGAD